MDGQITDVSTCLEGIYYSVKGLRPERKKLQRKPRRTRQGLQVLVGREARQVAMGVILARGAGINSVTME